MDNLICSEGTAILFKSHDLRRVKCLLRISTAINGPHESSRWGSNRILHYKIALLGGLSVTSTKNHALF